MSVDTSMTGEPANQETAEVSAEQVAAYLTKNPEFFLDQDELIAQLSLPHESGKAISLLERQVTVLRERGTQARQKLGSLLDNARNNDQLFDTTRNLVLALLRANTSTELAEACQDQLSDHENIDACEVIFIEHNNLNVSQSTRTYPPKKMLQDFKDVFRHKRSFCGALESWQLEILFADKSGTIKSTALCPIIHNDEVLALIAFGNQSEDYFSVHLDTLFLDFIGHVVGEILSKQLEIKCD